jgi:flavin-dependent dehydrogenase
MENKWSSKMKSYDVMIIGAGLAGLQCARLLAKSGATVAIVDRKTSVAKSIHTTGIFVRRTLEDFDIPDSCLGPPIRHVTLYSPAWRTLPLESPYDEFRVGRMNHLYTHYLKECLHAGVNWLPSSRYFGCEVAKNSSIVRLEIKGRARHFRTRYLVGADGALSRVARDLGLELNREWIVGVEDVWRDVAFDGEPRFHCFLDPDLSPGYLAWLVHDGEETHVGVGGYAARFNPLQALEKFRHNLKAIVDLQQAKHVERRGGRIPVGGILRRIANERGLLVGDAAGAVSPLTAGGLDPCMRLSSLASSVIANYLKTEDSNALTPYSGELFRARFVSRLWMRKLMSSVKQPALMEAACAILRLPMFRRLAWHVFFGRGSFPDIEMAPALSAST